MASGKDGDKLFIVQRFTKSISVNPTSGLDITQTQLGYSVPQGYTYFSIAGFYTGHSSVMVSRIDMDESTCIQLFNGSASTRTGTFRVDITFIRTDALETYTEPT